MIKVGLIGEAPNDTDAIQNLLNRIYPGQFQFVPLITNIIGSMLDNPKTKSQLRREYDSHNPKIPISIFIRDLDGLESDKEKKDAKKKYFKDFNSVIDDKGVFLLSIYELEAFILSDIDMFNAEYKCSIVYDKDPSLQKQPKEFLRNNTKHPNKYEHSHNSDLFNKIDIEKVKNKCSFFATFLKEFVNKIN